MVLLAIIRHVEWADGTGCKASIPTLAREAHQTKKTTIGHIKALIDAGLISRKRRQNLSSWTDIATLASVAATLTASVETTLTGQRSRYASNQSSSSNPINQLVTPEPEIGNVKQEDLDLDLDHVGTEFFSFSEEEGTETPVDERVRAEEYIKAHAPPVPTGPFPREYMTYLFPVWKYPTHPHGWKYGLEAAIKHVTSSQQRWKKCLADSVEHLAKKGLPPTDTAKEPLRCDLCQKVSMAYQDNQVLRSLSETFVDKCDECLSRQPAGVV